MKTNRNPVFMMSSVRGGRFLSPAWEKSRAGSGSLGGEEEPLTLKVVDALAAGQKVNAVRLIHVALYQVPV